MSYQNIFKNPEQEASLDRNGYLATPFLNADELKEIRDFYESVHPNGQLPHWRDGIHMTIWCPDRQYKDYVTENITRIVTPACERFFDDYRVVNPVFIVKQTGQGTNFPVHQDWTVTNENKYKSFNVWVPLQDVDEHSGAIWVLPGSQNIAPAVRGPGELFPVFDNILKYINPKMKSINLKAGEAAMFFHKVIHGSPPNLAPTPRISLCISILPKEAPLQVYFQKNNKSPLEIYEPADDFMLDYNNLRDESLYTPPKGKPVALAPTYCHPEISAESFETLYSNAVKLGLLEYA